MLRDFLFGDMDKASIADKNGIRPQRAVQIINRELPRYKKDPEGYFKEETV